MDAPTHHASSTGYNIHTTTCYTSSSVNTIPTTTCNTWTPVKSTTPTTNTTTNTTIIVKHSFKPEDHTTTNTNGRTAAESVKHLTNGWTLYFSVWMDVTAVSSIEMK
ncbi:uncharacterized protein [Dysidea avara]|uniref:uncharacterized protein n=1 Tax=Dysidea avara TaxID=196820 RepID=UPI00331CAD63